MNKTIVLIFIMMGIILLIVSCQSKSGIDRTINTPRFLEKGKLVVNQAQSVLGKNLMTAIQKEGTEYALKYCNYQAIPLTDSMSIELKASIKRVSDQPRNPNNKANNNELEYIQSTKKLLEKGENANPVFATSWIIK